MTTLLRFSESPFVITKEPEAGEGEEAVEHQQLVAEVVVPEVLGGGIEGEAEQRGGDADIRDEAVVGLPAGEESEGEEAEQGAVGVGGEDIDGIDERRGVDGPEQEDEQDEDEADDDVHVLAQPFVVGLAADIDAIAGGKRCQCGVGTGERGRDDADDE